MEFKNQFLKLFHSFRYLCHLHWMRSFALNRFTHWPFNQCHISPGAYIGHMLGAQHCIQFLQRIQNKWKTFKSRWGGQGGKIHRRQQISWTSGIVLSFKNRLNKNRENEKQEDISMGNYLREFFIFKVSCYLANNSFLTWWNHFGFFLNFDTAFLPDLFNLRVFYSILLADKLELLKQFLIFSSIIIQPTLVSAPSPPHTPRLSLSLTPIHP